MRTESAVLTQLMLEKPSEIVSRLFKDETGNSIKLTDYQNEELKKLFELLRTKKRAKVCFLQCTRSGKSELLSIFIALVMLFFPNEKIANLSYIDEQAKIIFERTRSHLVTDNEEVRQHVNFQRSMITGKEFSKSRMFMKNGTEFRVFSTGRGETEMTAEGLLGFGASIIICDEAGSIADVVYRTKIQRMTADARRPVIAIFSGTPHRRNFFYKEWINPMNIKFHVPWQKAVEAGQISMEAIEDAKQTLTTREFHNWWEAEFSDEDEDSLFKLKDIELGEREVTINLPYEQSVLGVDVARFGRDKTVFINGTSYGSLIVVKNILPYFHKDTMETTGKIVKYCQENHVDKVIVDEVGVGGGVVDRLRELEDFEPSIIPFVEGATPHNQDLLHRPLTELERLENKKYLNQKAINYVKLANRFEKGSIVIPKSFELKRDLLTIKVAEISDGKLKIVDEKDKGKSPDFADALMIMSSGFNETKAVFDFV